MLTTLTSVDSLIKSHENVASRTSLAESRLSEIEPAFTSFSSKWQDYLKWVNTQIESVKQLASCLFSLGSGSLVPSGESFLVEIKGKLSELLVEVQGFLNDADQYLSNVRAIVLPQPSPASLYKRQSKLIEMMTNCISEGEDVICNLNSVFS
ncbi:hypothetical protein GEMRC1_006417 [Eukaryota sp. GEM-RC1]